MNLTAGSLKNSVANFHRGLVLIKPASVGCVTRTPTRVKPRVRIHGNDGRCVGRTLHPVFMSNYPWTCKVCGSANEVVASECSTCRFPSCASSVEIDAARSSGISPSNPFVPQPPAPCIPLSRKLLGWFVLVLMVTGAGLAKFAPPVWLNFIGIAIVGLGLLVGRVLGIPGKGPHA